MYLLPIGEKCTKYYLSSSALAYISSTLFQLDLLVLLYPMQLVCIRTILSGTQLYRPLTK
ncbi:uncharacterized protein PHALS_04378 [Plasmopara halstedii]|uniref:Uncharacterized protein n=1 Tax=Plasmopara halstedii TaxID=4781 RepID=A0A0P1AYG2_PLAHL|nr:uncharacterized protein PHALS_04378 [Plasmopara halstedii]CEG47510.1 hypothetical protein PHALS_04378 [Plasmopara halstedii]|eukprot:XP_024583879.1 hypothetical protein PHALS_04378 [Plasmopara halstedii]